MFETLPKIFDSTRLTKKKSDQNEKNADWSNEHFNDLFETRKKQEFVRFFFEKQNQPESFFSESFLSVRWVSSPIEIDENLSFMKNFEFEIFSLSLEVTKTIFEAAEC